MKLNNGGKEAVQEHGCRALATVAANADNQVRIRSREGALC